MDVSREKLLALEEKQKLIDREPFRNLRIDDPSVLDCVEGREICEKCYKSRKFFCYTCCTPVIEQKYFPRVKLPIKIDIIKHAREIDGKSTAIHAAILAPEDVKIYTYPEFPVFSKNDRVSDSVDFARLIVKRDKINPDKYSKDSQVVLIFPSQTASTVNELFTPEYKREYESSAVDSENKFPVTRAVFIDSTWHQTKAIYKDQRLRDLPCVILKSRISQFWRHQKKSPRWYLATVEAIHQFVVELHECAFGIMDDYVSRDNLDLRKGSESARLYTGEYDNLLYFFKYMYEKIHTIYDHDKLWAYKRPLI